MKNIDRLTKTILICTFPILLICIFLLNYYIPNDINVGNHIIDKTICIDDFNYSVYNGKLIKIHNNLFEYLNIDDSNYLDIEKNKDNNIIALANNKYIVLNNKMEQIDEYIFKNKYIDCKLHNNKIYLLSFSNGYYYISRIDIINKTESIIKYEINCDEIYYVDDIYIGINRNKYLNIFENSDYTINNISTNLVCVINSINYRINISLNYIKINDYEYDLHNLTTNTKNFADKMVIRGNKIYLMFYTKSNSKNFILTFDYTNNIFNEIEVNKYYSEILDIHNDNIYCIAKDGIYCNDVKIQKANIDTEFISQINNDEVNVINYNFKIEDKVKSSLLISFSIIIFLISILLIIRWIFLMKKRKFIYIINIFYFIFGAVYSVIYSITLIINIILCLVDTTRLYYTNNRIVFSLYLGFGIIGFISLLISTNYKIIINDSYMIKYNLLNIKKTYYYKDMNYKNDDKTILYANNIEIKFIYELFFERRLYQNILDNINKKYQ